MWTLLASIVAALALDNIELDRYQNFKYPAWAGERDAQLVMYLRVNGVKVRSIGARFLAPRHRRPLPRTIQEIDGKSFSVEGLPPVMFFPDGSPMPVDTALLLMFILEHKEKDAETSNREFWEIYWPKPWAQGSHKPEELWRNAVNNHRKTPSLTHVLEMLQDREPTYEEVEKEPGLNIFDKLIHMGDRYRQEQLIQAWDPPLSYLLAGTPGQVIYIFESPELWTVQRMPNRHMLDAVDEHLENNLVGYNFDDSELMSRFIVFDEVQRPRMSFWIDRDDLQIADVWVQGQQTMLEILEKPWDPKWADVHHIEDEEDGFAMGAAVLKMLTYFSPDTSKWEEGEGWLWFDETYHRRKLMAYLETHAEEVFQHNNDFRDFLTERDDMTSVDPQDVFLVWDKALHADVMRTGNKSHWDIPHRLADEQGGMGPPWLWTVDWEVSDDTESPRPEEGRIDTIQEDANGNKVHFIAQFLVNYEEDMGWNFSAAVQAFEVDSQGNETAIWSPFESDNESYPPVLKEDVQVLEFIDFANEGRHYWDPNSEEVTRFEVRHNVESSPSLQWLVDHYLASKEFKSEIWELFDPADQFDLRTRFDLDKIFAEAVKPPYGWE